MIPTGPERPRKREASSAVVVLCVALTLAVGGVHYLQAISQLGDTASSNSSLSFDDREIAGGNSIVVDQRAPYEARALIPVNDSYHVVVGSSLHQWTELTQGYVAQWLTYFLMPRRPKENAKWIICYGCDSTTLGSGYEVRWRDREGISIGRLP
jgi:hypothetical protein